MTLRNTLAAGAALLPLALLSTPAFAQSTGSQDFENEIVVTGTSTKNGVAGVIAPDTTKAKVVLTQEFIARQSPGQTINDVINQLPGVSFQNNDPFGSAGGKMTIRGFDNTRISQTFDGIPLNDSGNYALYSNQQLDPELIEQVNVNLGSTDVDSPTAAASGSTVNYRTRTPGEEFGVKLVGSAGDFNFFRVFGMIDTGVLTPWGTRAFISGSSSTNDTVFSNVDQPTFKAHRGRINKKQFNAKIYQPIGDDGDFVAVSGHYNENRNNFFGSVPLRNDPDRVVGSASSNRFPLTRDERDYGIARCQINTAARPGVADVANSCGSTFDERMNPSNTGNIRVNSRFTLAPGLVLTVDPSFQYVKANGGGTVVGQEVRRDVNPTGGAANCNTTANGAAVSCQTGYIGGTPYFGRDLNGDGDLLDTVRLLAPSQTGTHRYGVIAGLRYELDDANTFRVFYSLDRARHRQTGEVGLLKLNGQPIDPFPINDPLTDVNGNVLEKRDRKSIATLNLFGGEYRGEFGQLTVQVGGSYKMFKRDLTNNCATSSATGFVECFGTNDAGLAAWLANNPTVVIAPGVTAPVQGPQQRIRKYNKFTPNVGLTFDATDALSVFANYSKGVQVPGTDNLYNAFYFPTASEQANPKPETTDNFDVGVRYTTSKIQGQLGLWYTIFNDRLASSFDPETERNVYRNLGRVDKYGIDASISYRPIPEFSIYAFGSYLKSKIKDDVVNGVCSAVSATCAAIGDPIYALTKGKRESGSPTFTLGGRVQGQLGPVELGAQIKRTGPRYINDQNTPLYQTVAGVPNTVVWGAKAPAYTLVDLDARVALDWAGLGDKVYFQFNVTNLFDKLYVGGFDGQLANTTVPNVNIGAPRTFIGSLIVGF